MPDGRLLAAGKVACLPVVSTVDVEFWHIGVVCGSAFSFSLQQGVLLCARGLDSGVTRLLLLRRGCLLVQVSDIKRANGILSDNAMFAREFIKIPTAQLPIG